MKAQIQLTQEEVELLSWTVVLMKNVISVFLFPDFIIPSSRSAASFALEDTDTDGRIHVSYGKIWARDRS